MNNLSKEDKIKVATYRNESNIEIVPKGLGLFIPFNYRGKYNDIL